MHFGYARFVAVLAFAVGSGALVGCGARSPLEVIDVYDGSTAPTGPSSSGGDSCVRSCTTNEDCQRSCEVVEDGGASCCDLPSASCYVIPKGATCSAPVVEGDDSGTPLQ